MAGVKFSSGIGPDPRKVNVRKVAVSTVTKPSKVAKGKGKKFGIGNLKTSAKAGMMAC